MKHYSYLHWDRLEIYDPSRFVTIKPQEIPEPTFWEIKRCEFIWKWKKARAIRNRCIVFPVLGVTSIGGIIGFAMLGNALKNPVLSFTGGYLTTMFTLLMKEILTERLPITAGDVRFNRKK